MDLFNDQVSPHQIDLLGLQDGVTFDLTGEVPIPEGSYGQLRFVVDVANIVLEDGFTFSDDSSEKSLKVPSGFFRVILHGEEDEGDDSGNLVFEGGETEVVLVDFDVSSQLRLSGATGQSQRCPLQAGAQADAFPLTMTIISRS